MGAVAIMWNKVTLLSKGAKKEPSRRKDAFRTSTNWPSALRMIFLSAPPTARIHAWGLDDITKDDSKHAEV
jgi:hypothetical protein